MLKDALSVGENFILNLYKNLYSPASGSILSDFTVADFTDYAAMTLARTTWSAAETVAGKASSTYGATPLSWTCGATGNTVHGYYVTGATSNTVLWAEQFASARVLASADVLNLTPKFTLASE